MNDEKDGLRLHIFMHESWRHKHMPLYRALVEHARQQGLAGATVSRGIMGFGAHSTVHEPHLFHLSNDLPLVIELVDAVEKVEGFLPRLTEMVQAGLLTVSDVEIDMH